MLNRSHPPPPHCHINQLVQGFEISWPNHRTWERLISVYMKLWLWLQTWYLRCSSPWEHSSPEPLDADPLRSMDSSATSFISSSLRQESSQVRAACSGRIPEQQWCGESSSCPQLHIQHQSKDQRTRDNPILADYVSELQHVQTLILRRTHENIEYYTANIKQVKQSTTPLI